MAKPKSKKSRATRKTTPGRKPLRTRSTKSVSRRPSTSTIVGREHWTSRGEVKLFLWEKYLGDPKRAKGIVLFVHGSSMASQPTFDLKVPGRADSSVMDWFARQGYDTW